MSIDSKDLLLFFAHEINALRRSPADFIKPLQGRLANFKDELTYQRSDISCIQYKTTEGKKAVNQAIEWLSGAASVKPLNLSVQLCEIAYHISLEMAKEAKIGDVSHYKKLIKDTIRKYNCIIENLELVVEYGFRKDYEVIPSILVDDSNASRSRRHSLLNPSHQFVGIAAQEHPEYDFLVLILLTDYITIEHEPPTHAEPSHCTCSLI